VNWQLQQAKNQLSKVVHAAIEEGPQTITLRGKKAAVVISVEEYQRLTHRRERGSLVDFFTDPSLVGEELDIERSKELGRDIEL
jgi:prevent-host-death family protein